MTDEQEKHQFEIASGLSIDAKKIRNAVDKASDAASEDAEATFAVSLKENEKSVKPGELVSYLITLKSQSGFSDTISFFESGLPKNVEASFSPEKIQLSEEQPIDVAQLTLIVPEEIEAKDYEITVLATSENGKVQKYTNRKEDKYLK